ncbi:hypothetical protein AMTRI_Chr02g265020 [Amborella trichopoda]|uniref:ABC transporter domain-containing protein n=1 Tax=Amborella trichopoda TaxID=13333 RepID=U5D3K7_AMBTC|nr:ABC transporter G family member 14 [Amborella trichopoda]ERN17004.1 hypothetical protein AMTR_s00057p00214480 [Amborella trichopoda]|eukprot:XP_006855537.3 ABC transporter G family member 14 [Amborella trichopoda]
MEGIGGAEMELATPAVDSETHDLLRQPIQPISVKFEDVVYKIKGPNNKEKEKCSLLPLGARQPDAERTILKGITGAVRPGEMLALLGPSGSGKTTFLSALGGRLPLSSKTSPFAALGGCCPGKLSGSIKYNGHHFSDSINRRTGFVTQDDILYPHLTVYESLLYTALLRLPNTLSKGEKVRHADAVISELGLSACKTSIIGGQFLRGVSGGEKKRVSIGQEMLINPSLLLLDEPTSGLDSTTAQRIVSTLWELAKAGRTVVMTIHQPSSRLFYMFHKVILLSDGHPVYIGQASTAMEYFAGIGHAPSVAMNPADFLLDLANGVSSDGVDQDQRTAKQRLVTAYATNLKAKVVVDAHAAEQLAMEFGEEKRKKQEWHTTWWQQFRVLLERGLKERRHEAFSRLKLFQVFTVSLLSGLLWWHSDTTHLQDQVGLLFFCTNFWGFFPLFQSIFTFPQERLMLHKERSSAMYRLSAYFMARIAGDLPMELLLPTSFVTIIYWMGGLKPDPLHFLCTLFVVLYNVLIAGGLGLAIGAMVMNLRNATTLGSVITLTFMLTGGYFIQKVPVFMAWIRYISMTHYTFKLLLGSQYSVDEMYECEPGKSCRIADFPMIKAIGLDHMVRSALVLWIMLVGYRLVAYASLTRIGKIN